VKLNFDINTRSDPTIKSKIKTSMRVNNQLSNKCSIRLFYPEGYTCIKKCSDLQFVLSINYYFLFCYNTLMFKSIKLNLSFPEMEKEILNEWKKKGIVEKYLHRNDESEKRFSFLDGPITANNPMGVHHAWGRTYKDLWQRFYNMQGYNQRFQNGFDCQGLWVEVEVEKELGIRNKKDIENLVSGNKKASIAKFVQLCRERVLKYSEIQSEQSKRLGYFMDWDNSYYTMSDENNYLIWHFIKTCHEKGWIYKGKDSVPWCPRCETAISQHEMLTEDYKELTHETVFIKFKIQNSKFKIKVNNLYLLVWTTTPWTVPANVAVGVNTKFTYAVWKNKETGEGLVIIDKDESGKTPMWNIKGKDIQITEVVFGKSGYEKVSEIDGKDLVGLKYEAPFDFFERVKTAEKENPNSFHTVIDGSAIVTSTEGTGLLHVAPGAGKEDFDLGKKEKLPVISVIGDDASYLDGMGDFSAKNAKKHPELIIDFLKNEKSGKFLFKTLNYTHRYPACWRCKAELVWKVTYEWYIAMDRPSREASSGRQKNKTLREEMIETAKMIKWNPSFGLERELDWLNNMHDWLISKKNRYWGLALPIYECKKCGTFEIIGSFQELKAKAVAGWKEFEGKSPHKPYIDEVKIKCPKCCMILSRIDDVGNVWLDAGSVPFSTYIDPETKKLSYTEDKKYWEKWFPVDFITESFPGQFKNWFYSMIAMSTVLEKRNPYKTVLGYASMLGEDGRAMHKSWGNSIEFNEGADKIGVDVMRWLFVTHDPEQNLLFGYKKADEARRKFHILLWNVYNYFITYANLYGWSAKEKNIGFPLSENILDEWIISELNSVMTEVTENLSGYSAYFASNTIQTFVSDLSQWYIRRSRERLSPEGRISTDSDAFFNTLYGVLIRLSQMLAPFVPFISEEIYTNLTGETSVHLSNWPENDKSRTNKELELQMSYARMLVEAGHSLRKEKSLKTRQPLLNACFKVNGKKLTDKKVLEQVLRELNIKRWVVGKDRDAFISDKGVISKELNGFVIYINTNLSDELIKEGKARDIIRNIQILRKESGCLLTEKIKVQLPNWPEEFENLIKKETFVTHLKQGKEMSISR
jgi:isoleucyl-tRNA synthetase